MQIFPNGKWRFYSFMEFYVIHLKNQGVKIWSQYYFKRELWNKSELTKVGVKDAVRNGLNLFFGRTSISCHVTENSERVPWVCWVDPVLTISLGLATYQNIFAGRAWNRGCRTFLCCEKGSHTLQQDSSPYFDALIMQSAIIHLIILQW